MNSLDLGMACETRNILMNHVYNKELKYYAASYSKGRFIDIDCDTKPYKGFSAMDKSERRTWMYMEVEKKP